MNTQLIDPAKEVNATEDRQLKQNDSKASQIRILRNLDRELNPRGLPKTKEALEEVVDAFAGVDVIETAESEQTE